MLLHITAFVVSLLMQPGVQIADLNLADLQDSVQTLIAVIDSDTTIEDTDADVDVAILDEDTPEVDAPAADIAEDAVEPAPATVVIEEVVVDNDVVAEPIVEIADSVEPQANDLDSIADVWPTLSDSTRQSILMLIEADKLTQE